MIPERFISQWREKHPWPDDAQVEQDLMISRALVELFSDDLIATSLAFRGGTALNKLYLNPNPRYSEDIDLVQVNSGAIGPILKRIKEIFDPWFIQSKKRSVKQNINMATIHYNYLSTNNQIERKLKIEINTREKTPFMGYINKDFQVTSDWFTGTTRILTYRLEELMGTKLRALYQRNKGRDLFDNWYVMNQCNLDGAKTLEVFQHYLKQQGLSVSRAQFEMNLHRKASMPSFLDDILPLLRKQIRDRWNPKEALDEMFNLIARLPGDPWKGR